MKSYKLVIAVIFMISLAVTLCGCADVNSGKKIVASNLNSNQISYPIVEESTSSTSSNGREDKSKDTNSFPTKCKIYKQTMKLFTEEQLLSLFSGTPEKVDTYKGRIEYKTATERGFVSDSGVLYFSTPAGNKFDTICALDFLKENNIEGYVDGELDFATRDEILEQVKALMQDNFELAPEDWYIEKFYAMKKEAFDLYKELILQEAAQIATSSTEYEHKKLDEESAVLKNITGEDYYFISLRFKLDSIPTFPARVFYYSQDNSKVIIGSMGTMIFTKNGIEYAAFNNMRDTDKANAVDVNIISSEEAKELMQKKIDSVIWEGEVDIYDVKLEYLPIPQNNLGESFTRFDTRPFYAVYYNMPEKVNNQLVLSKVITYFDAVTGEELGTEWIETD